MSQVAWYALKTRSRHEKQVARALAGRRVECFLPLMRRRSRRRDRVRTVDVPLFSTYLFVRLDPRERLDALTVRGAVALLGAGGQPTPVPEDEIRPLVTLAETGAPLEPHRFLRPGQRVRVCSGPFAGVEGTLARSDGKSKLVISVDLLKQAAALTIDALDTEPVE